MVLSNNATTDITKWTTIITTQLYPDNKIPKLETEREKMKTLISERDKLNSEYKETKNDIEKMEIAKQSIDEYLTTQDRSGRDL